MALDLSVYPPKAHQERINTYQRFERLFLGQHKQVFAVTPQPYQMKRYIAANFAGLISRLSADLLFGKESVVATTTPPAPRLTSTTGSSSKINKRQNPAPAIRIPSRHPTTP